MTDEPTDTNTNLANMAAAALMMQGWLKEQSAEEERARDHADTADVRAYAAGARMAYCIAEAYLAERLAYAARVGEAVQPERDLGPVR